MDEEGGLLFMLVPYRRKPKPPRTFSKRWVIFIAVFLFFGSSIRSLAQGGTDSDSSQQGQDDPSTTSEERQSSRAATQQISEAELAGLPLQGRSYTQLATLEAGVSDNSRVDPSRGVGVRGGLNVSGARGTANVFLLDGTNIMGIANRPPRSAAGVQLGSDAALQVQVFSTNYSAEYGRGSGGVLNSITRSGTPEFHGTFFEFLRNSKLDARNFFDPGPSPPPFKRNQFGFTLSGPIRPERTFFMASFEALRDRLTSTDVSTFPDEDARVGRITDRDGNVMRTVEVHASVKPYLELFPLPNFERLGGGVGESRNPRFQPSDEEFFVVRVDHQISARDSLFVRYTFDDARSVGGGTTYLFQNQRGSRQQYFTVMETHIFSPSAISSFRFGYTRPVETSDNISAIEIPRDMFFIPDSPDFGQLSIPRVSGFGHRGGPSGDVLNTFQLADDVILQRGLHAIKFGVQIQRTRADTFTNSSRGGVWSFSSLESFLRGGPEGTTLTGVLPGSDDSQAWRQTLFGFYIQNAYRVRANLRFDLGLRYQFSTVIHDKDGKSVFIADPLRDTEPLIGPYLDHNPSLRNISPRLGISWSPGTSGKTAIRTGFGIYYDQLIPYLTDHLSTGAPFYKRTVRTNFNASGKEADGTSLPYAFPDAVAPLQGMPLQAGVLDRNFKNPMVLRYDLVIQQELPGRWSSQLAYVGARGNRLDRHYEFNLYPFPEIRSDGTLFFPPQCDQLPSDAPTSELELCRPYAGPMNPAFAGGLDYMGSDGQSFYNSFRIAVNKRLSSGTSFQFRYTLSKSVDDDSHQEYPHIRTSDRALSDFDARHQLNLNYFYRLPFGRGQRWLNSNLLANLLGGWRIGGIVRFRTGTAFSPGNNVRRPGYLFETGRPNLGPGQSNTPAVKGATVGCGNDTIKAEEKLGTPERYFDPCIYAFPEFGTLGNAGRNTITAPGLFNTDVSLQREFPLGGDRRLQLRMDVFNSLNRTNFSAPRGSGASVFSGDRDRVNPSVGRISGTSTTSRQVQFALRFSF